MKKIVVLFLFVSSFVTAQNLYKTPSGRRYHLASCRMVKNVSSKVTIDDIKRFRLTPCKICKPRYYVTQSNRFSSFRNKSVGVSNTTRCKGRTKRGTRCKHKTRLANGYCFQHKAQAR